MNYYTLSQNFKETPDTEWIVDPALLCAINTHLSNHMEFPVYKIRFGDEKLEIEEK